MERRFVSLHWKRRASSIRCCEKSWGQTDFPSGRKTESRALGSPAQSKIADSAMGSFIYSHSIFPEFVVVHLLRSLTLDAVSRCLLVCIKIIKVITPSFNPDQTFVCVPHVFGIHSIPDFNSQASFARIRRCTARPARPRCIMHVLQ